VFLIKERAVVLSNNLKAKVPKPPAKSNIPPNSEATLKIDKRYKPKVPSLNRLSTGFI
tara:strand:- start:1562 stop:1735 length:174 start_codon:yes stop_codon:yes gene_type:complete